MNILSQELKMSVASMLYWTGALVFFVFIFMFMYPPISRDAAIIENVLSNFPLELRRALGITTLNLSQLLGFYGFIFVYVLLIGSVYAMKSGISVLSEEVRSKTVDFLLAKPVSRKTVVSAKILSVLSNLIVQNILFIVISYLIISAYKQDYFDMAVFTLLDLSLIQVQLFFAALGFFLSVIIKKIKSVLPISLAMVFVFFILQMLGESLNDPKLVYITPFSYFNAADIINNGSYQLSFLLINLTIILILTGSTYLIYLRKDLPSI